eukprot:3767869-Amphidinium_carterae.1
MRLGHTERFRLEIELHRWALLIHSMMLNIGPFVRPYHDDMIDQLRKHFEELVGVHVQLAVLASMEYRH